MDFAIKNLGKGKHKSPVFITHSDEESLFVDENRKMLYRIFTEPGISQNSENKECFELAGPRKTIYFNPTKIRSAIVTCGGLCPGINEVIRSIVMESYYQYGSKSILGIRYGYNGLNPSKGYEPVELTPDFVEDIHLDGGTILGSSRGGTEDMEMLVETLVKLKINILYTIGGDGTLKGAHKIADIALRRGIDLAVVGIPKTIDNDISFIQRSFGFETAFSKAVDAISTGHVEAKGAPNGIGLVKLMGRFSGFIAANAALAMNDANFVLIPEVPFDLHGDNGFLAHLKKRMLKRGHAVICVAEGAGQNLLMKDESAKMFDASGNPVLQDVGLFLKDRIIEFFIKEKIEINLKYIDPSYIIRSAPAVPNDSVMCTMLGQYAVHAGMAGKTDLVIGLWNNIYTHVPIELAVSVRKQIDIHSKFWFSVIAATGQPYSMLN